MLRSPVFLGGQAVSMLGDGLAILAIPLIVLQLSRSPLLAVLASLPGIAGYLAAGLPAGVLADRLDPWQLLIATDVLRTLIFLALFALTGSRAISAYRPRRSALWSPQAASAACSGPQARPCWSGGPGRWQR